MPRPPKCPHTGETFQPPPKFARPEAIEKLNKSVVKQQMWWGGGNIKKEVEFMNPEGLNEAYEDDDDMDYDDVKDNLFDDD